jgi:geranylgeranyl diphosphate synthase type I
VTNSSAASPTADVADVLARYRDPLTSALRQALAEARSATTPAAVTASLLDELYGQIEYHLGWRGPDLKLTQATGGKLLRPTLLLLACELVAGRLGLDVEERVALVRRAMPAAICVELVHNFSLVHDDIEDRDAERHHRPTLWKLWGVPQALNTGDGIFALARASLWSLLDSGVEARVVVRLAELVDRSSLELCEGQFLDMRSEGREEVTAATYLDMIGRKTAALMACSTEMGALLAAPEQPELAAQLARFGRDLGMAFQLRDDLLGIWSAEQLGKTAAGDLRRKKMSLPVIHALETATAADRATLQRIYGAPGAATKEQIAAVLAVLERADARTRVRAALRAYGASARAALDVAAGDVPATREPLDLFAVLLNFVISAAD